MEVAWAQSEPPPENGVAAILKVFDRYPVVLIGEGHGIKEAGDFYIALVKDSGFQAKVNDVVVEFGSRKSQPVVDRYINGQAVPAEELRTVWRNSTKVNSWEAATYSRFLAAVREVNRTLPANRRLRVLVGDTYIDWNKIQTHEEWEKSQPNDNSFSEVVNTEVLDKHRKALVILGSNHVTKAGNADGDDDTTTLIEAKHPKSTFVVMLLLGNRFLKDPEKVAGWTPSAFYPVKGTWLESIPTLRGGADAVLYLGTTLTNEYPPNSSLEPEYVKELTRRYKIVYGCEVDVTKKKTGERPCPIQE